MDKFVSRIPSSARSSSIDFVLSFVIGKHTEQQLDLSNIDFFFAIHQDCLPDGCSFFISISPKNLLPPLQKDLPLLAFFSGCGTVVRVG